MPAAFDPVVAFMGYAEPTITGEIRRHLRDHARVVHAPRPVKEIQARLWRAVAELSVEHGISQVQVSRLLRNSLAVLRAGMAA